MKLLQSIMLAGALSALALPTFAMDDDGDPSKTDPFYRAASGKTHMSTGKHQEGVMKDDEMSKMHKQSSSHRYSVFSRSYILNPATDNR